MIRFYLLILFFLISLLSFLKAPTYHLWLLAIGVTEFPLIFAAITTTITLTGFWAQKFQLAGTLLGVLTILIFLSPIVRAFWVSNNVKIDMSKAFDGVYGNGSFVIYPEDKRVAFSIFKLFNKAESNPHTNITYIKYQDTAMTLDFYSANLNIRPSTDPPHDLPEAATNKRPCVIVIHGGSWAGGDSQQLPELNSYLAVKGYNVASINYRMAPKWQTPAPVEDVKNAIAYLKKNADSLHIDTNKFVLLGRSAGAQIALLAAYTLHEKDIKGVIDFYGPSDMVWGYSIPSNPLIMNSRKVMEDYIGGTYKQVPENYYNCSPIEFVSKQSPPTLIIHGENDVLVSREHSRRLNLKLEHYNIKHYWLQLPWATHGFDYNLNGPGGQLSTYAVETFLDTVCQ